MSLTPTIHLGDTAAALRNGEDVDLTDVRLCTLARLVQYDWRTKDGRPNVWFGAVPYLEAMLTLDTVDPKQCSYGYDDGTSIVIYFVSNAAQWRGPVARAVKAELKRRFR